MLLSVPPNQVDSDLLQFGAAVCAPKLADSDLSLFGAAISNSRHLGAQQARAFERGERNYEGKEALNATLCLCPPYGAQLCMLGECARGEGEPVISVASDGQT